MPTASALLLNERDRSVSRVISLSLLTVTKVPALSVYPISPMDVGRSLIVYLSVCAVSYCVPAMYLTPASPSEVEPLSSRTVRSLIVPETSLGGVLTTNSEKLSVEKTKLAS